MSHEAVVPSLSVVCNTYFVCLPLAFRANTVVSTADNRCHGGRLSNPLHHGPTVAIVSRQDVNIVGAVTKTD